MSAAGRDALADLLTARLLTVPGVLAVYPHRNTAAAVIGALSTTPSKPQVRVAEQDGSTTVEATIGIADRDSARDVAQRAYDVLLRTLDTAGVSERYVVVRIATVD